MATKIGKCSAALWLIASLAMPAAPFACRKKDSPPPPAAKTLTDSGGLEMALIPAGEFLMGSEEGEEDERPAHKVRVGAFYMDCREVTQKSFESLLGMNTSRFRDPNRPVERLGWLAAAKYCNARSAKEGLTPCYNLRTLACDFGATGYRLPTEAEWEYACRAGTQGAYFFGAGADRLGEYAWTSSNAGQTTHPVGEKRPNPWGLYDMYGNVAEWCNDYYSPSAYSSADGNDPHGPASGDYRVLRGGSWRSGPAVCRSAARMGEPPGAGDTCMGYEAYGFRCVRRAGP
jgi:formylglycine-generating enzyme required for sulfatase activity